MACTDTCFYGNGTVTATATATATDIECWKSGITHRTRFVPRITIHSSHGQLITGKSRKSNSDNMLYICRFITYQH